MRIAAAFALVMTFLVAGPAAQARGTTQAPATGMRTEPAAVQCPQALGEGVQTKRAYCDVVIGADPAAGIVITLPPHTGAMTVSFDLHNRHTYSEELVKQGRAFNRYTATVGVLTADNTPLTKAVVQSEFRTAADLVDRIGGGSGPGGLKAVAPTGTERILVTIPADEPDSTISIIGLQLNVVRPDSPPDNFSAAGRPIALVSNVTVEYRPGPARRPATRR